MTNLIKNPGMDLVVHYGVHGDGEKAVLALYGDENHEGAGWAMQAADSEFPEDATLASHQKVSLYFGLSEYKPYGEVIKLADKVVKHFESKGWRSAPALQTWLGEIGDSIEDMIEADDLSQLGKLPGSYEDYPQVPGLDNGRWAAKGFIVKVERPDQKPEFSEIEIAEVEQIFNEAMKIVFGKVLEEVTL